MVPVIINNSDLGSLCSKTKILERDFLKVYATVYFEDYQLVETAGEESSLQFTLHVPAVEFVVKNEKGNDMSICFQYSIRKEVVIGNNAELVSLNELVLDAVISFINISDIKTFKLLKYVLIENYLENNFEIIDFNTDEKHLLKTCVPAIKEINRNFDRFEDFLLLLEV